jgi:hypothetical protein
MKNLYTKKITLDEIGHYSFWPSRLLGLKPYSIKYKNPYEINREFNVEKWGLLLNIFKNNPSLTLTDMETSEQNLEELAPIYDSLEGFFLSKLGLAQEKQLNIYKKIILANISGANGLVELGAGYGSKIFRLADAPEIKKIPLFAYEYTRSGRELINLLSIKEDIKIKVGHCDFNNIDLDEFDFPENSIIFTSFALHYASDLKVDFFKFISKLKPKLVIHFEPCYEYYDSQNLHGQMCRRYMEINGYTQNIASSIEDSCEIIGGKIKIEKNVFGSNPFMPFSIIQWSP